LWRAIRTADNGPSWVANMALGAGVFGMVFGSAGTAVMNAVALDLNEVKGASRFFYVLSGMMLGFTMFGIAALTAAVAIAITRTSMMPNWVCGASVLLSIAALVGGLPVLTLSDTIFTIGFIVFIVWMVWIIAVSVWMLRASMRTTTASPAPPREPAAV